MQTKEDRDPYSESHTLSRRVERKPPEAQAAVKNVPPESAPMPAGELEMNQAEPTVWAEERYRTLLANLSVGVFRSTPEGKLLSANPALVRMLGYDSEEEFLKVPAADCYSNVERREEFIAQLKAEGAVTDFEFEARCKDSSTVCVLASARAVLNRGGDLVYVDGIVEDVTKRRRAEEALRESEENFRAIADYTHDWENWVGPDGRVLWINPAVKRITGYAVAECLSMPAYPLFLIHEDDRPTIASVFEQAANKGTSGHDLAFRFRHKDGSIRWGAVSWQPILNAEGVCLGQRSSIRDITERKQAEELVRRRQSELAHFSRLSVMGEMASAMAHELNQPLAAIANYTNGCLRRLRARAGGGDDEVVQALEHVSAQARRAGEIIRQLRNFVRKGESSHTSVYLNEIIQEVTQLVRGDLSQNDIALHLNLGDGIPSVLADTVQIQQVLLNLVRNGIEALADCGPIARSLTIETSVSQDELACVAVRDNGAGLSPGLANRIFDPFFTTKSKGMGMGLSISRSIVEAHGGRVWATPNPDRGTTIFFTVPVNHGAKS